MKGRCPAAIVDAVSSLHAGVSAPEDGWRRVIEAERQRLLARRAPLVDGSLGEGGLYDAGQSVRDACLVSKPAEQATLLMLLTRCLRPARVLELGTNVGISSAYIAAGLRLGGGTGKLWTLDASRYRQGIAREMHQRAHLGDLVSYVPGLFADTLRPTLRAIGAVDLVFIDGHHQYQPTLDYFAAILPFATQDTMFVFDDIRWSDGMLKAWKEIREDEQLGLVVDVQSMGICVPRSGGATHHVTGPLTLF